MNKPELYHNSHTHFKEDIGCIIKEHFPSRQWQREVGDTYLDIGTGPGDVSMKYIYPMLPTNFKKITFSDISKDMMEYAKNYYGTKEKSEYKVLDVSTKEGIPPEMAGQFDHVICINVLHWVSDIRFVLLALF